MKRMRLKYYLRALGIGIIVTALLMGYSQSSQAEMTDEEILRRAGELGMAGPQMGVLAEIATASPRPVEETEPTAAPTAEPATASEVSPSPEAEPTAVPEVSPSPQPDAEPTTAPTEEAVATPAVIPTEEPVSEPETVPTAESTASPEGNTVILVINRGENSVTVSKNLQQLGLVEDYKVFDRYLYDNGYDKFISTGTYEIPIDATEEEIAHIISKKR